MNSIDQNRINVLIADDDFSFNNNLSYNLKRRGDYNILNAYTVEDFKKLAPNADIIILDIRLHDTQHSPINPWGGLRALKELHEDQNIKSDIKERLKNVIIRSQWSKDQARNQQEDISEDYYFKWINVDAPKTKLLAALDELIKSLRK